MSDLPTYTPDHTAVRVALWRALHVQEDAPPHALEDVLGLMLAAPEEGWQKRPDMHKERTARSRASIVARARFIEDLVEERVAQGAAQYVLLGAGLDTFAQRRPALASRMRVYEVDAPTTQAWKRERLAALGFDVPPYLKFVPVDFEAEGALLSELERAGFVPSSPSVVASAGVAMYLTQEAIAAMLRHVAAFGPGCTFVMSFMLPLALVEPAERPGIEAAARGALARGTPFVSLFAPADMLALAREAGFKDVQHVSSAALTARYFSGRSDGVRPSSGEELLVATT
jgi:methyltransferase (TIGR00027 family)